MSQKYYFHNVVSYIKVLWAFTKKRCKGLDFFIVIVIIIKNIHCY